jgi:hypothetical protein
MTDLWNPMDTAPFDTWFLAYVEPEKSSQKLLQALGLPLQEPTIVVARRTRGDKLNQVRCSKRNVIYTAIGWNIPPVMLDGDA